MKAQNSTNIYYEVKALRRDCGNLVEGLLRVVFNGYALLNKGFKTYVEGFFLPHEALFYYLFIYIYKDTHERVNTKIQKRAAPPSTSSTTPISLLYTIT